MGLGLVASLVVSLSFIAVQGREVTIRDGRTFTAVTVERVENGEAILKHAGGIASVKLTDLPNDFRQEFGLLPSFEETRNSFGAAVRAWLESYETLNQHYGAALEQLERRLAAERREEDVEAVLAERETFRKNLPFAKSRVPELAKLQQTYEEQRTRWSRENEPRLLEISQIYLEALEGVMTRATKTNAIKEATAASDEIDRLRPIARDAEAIQLELGFGPASVLPGVAVAFSPDGDPADKKAGKMRVLVAGESIDVALPTEEQCEEVIAMHGNWETWAALKKDGTLVSSPLKGPGIPENHERVIWFRVGAGIVTAFHPDGSYSIYGEPEFPEDLPPEDLGPVMGFALDRESGIALSSSGKVRVWGRMYSNEEERKRIEESFETVRFVGASEKIAWAVDAEGRVFSWGPGGTPREIARHEDIAQFGGGRSAYLILTSEGELKGGGIDSEDPVIHVPEGRRKGQAIRVNYWGYALQFDDGSWHTWGGPPASTPLHQTMQAAGPLLDLEICGAPDRFLIMGLRR